MKNNPKEMTLAKLDVLVMPNGEILCEGNSIGYVSKLGKHLSNLRDAITGKTHLTVGQPVWHDHSGNAGVIKAIREDPSGYDYQVEFTVDFGVTRTDWYQGHVLKETM